MGLFDDQPEQDSGASLIQEQNRQSEIEMQQKKESLYKARLDIFKTQNKENFGAPTSYKPASANAGQ